MKYYVFTAANENNAAIKRAKETVENLEFNYLMEGDNTGRYEGSEFMIIQDVDYTSICVEDDDIYRLIKTCMDFAREQERLRKMEY